MRYRDTRDTGIHEILASSPDPPDFSILHRIQRYVRYRDTGIRGYMGYRDGLLGTKVTQAMGDTVTH